MLQLRNACGADDLMGLWKLCFPDRVAWAEVFMRDIFSPEHTLVAVEDGVLAGAVYDTAASFEFRGMDVPVTYLLGLGVHPDFRGRGIATEMIRRLCADTAEKNIPFLLATPCSERLFDFYGKLGFAASTWLARDPFTRKELTETDEKPQPMPPDAAFKANGIYEDVLRHRDHLHRDAAAWRFAALAAENAGGGMLALRREGEVCGYAIYERRQDQVLVREVFAFDEPGYDALRRGVLDAAGVDAAVMESPACHHNMHAYGMLRAADAAGVLALASAYRPMDLTLEVADELVAENNARYTVRGDEITKEARSGRVYLTPEQLVQTIMGVGPAPYANLLFS